MSLFWPEGIVLLTACLVLVGDLFPRRVQPVPIALAGLGLSLLSLLVLRSGGSLAALAHNFYWFDLFSLFFKGLFLGIGLIIVMINIDYFKAQVKKNEGEFYFLFLISLLGLMIVVSSPNLLLIYLGIEIVGQSSYLLAGWQKNLRRSGEAAIKYFLFGAVASAIFLYGVSLFYGLTGSFDLSRLLVSPLLSPLYYAALIFMVLGFGFKIAMAPMQFWCPDVYEGAPIPITAYLSVGPKAAGFAVLLRFITLARADLIWLFALLAAVTMTWGNLVALRQKNIKRLLAYSSIAQAGYILIGLVSPQLGYGVVGFYLLAYALANLGIFAIVIYLSLILQSENIDDYAGFARRSPALAGALALFLFSLIGIPPLAGFVGKFLIFKAAVGSGFLWLALLGVINSVVSVYYYLNILRVIYFKPGDETAINLPAAIALAVMACLIGTIVFGLFPDLAGNFFLKI